MPRQDNQDYKSGRWVTINHTPVFIKPGQSVSDAFEERENYKKEYTKTKHYIKMYGTGMYGFTTEEKYNPQFDEMIEFSDEELQDELNKLVDLKDFSYDKPTDYRELSAKALEVIKKITGDNHATINQYAKFYNNFISPILTEKADQYLKTLPKLDTKDLNVIDYGANRKNYNKSLDSPYNSPEYLAYTSNCQRCVAAWYLRHLGYDVEAMPYEGKYDNKTWTYEKGSSNAKISGWGWHKAMFQRNTIKTVFQGKNKQWASSQLKEITNIVKNDGPGACYMLSLSWRGSRDAHVAIVYNDAGEVRFIDPQNNRTNRENWFNPNLYALITEKTELIRIDQAKLNGEVITDIVRPVESED